MITHYKQPKKNTKLSFVIFLLLILSIIFFIWIWATKKENNNIIIENIIVREKEVIVPNSNIKDVIQQKKIRQKQIPVMPLDEVMNANY